MNALEVKDLHFSYSDQKNKKEALQGLSFSCQKGSIHGLLGPNGSGKSTCFKIISTQISIQKGDVLILGKNLKANSKEIRNDMGICFQSPSLDPLLSVEENLLLQASLFGISKSQASLRISELAKIFSLSDKLNLSVKQLSGGWARRVELTKSLLHSPKILLLDEPTTGLDPLVRREFWRELHKLRHEGVSIIVTTHHMEEAEMCDEISFIHQGKCVASGTPAQLKKEISSDVINLTFVEMNPTLLSKINSISKAEELSALNFRVRTDNAQKIIPTFMSEFGNNLNSLSWDKGNLADLYFLKTGENL